MKKLIWLLLCVSAFAQVKNGLVGMTAFSGTAGTSYQDALLITAPSSPAAGYNRIYMDTATGNFTCKKADGTSCISATASSPFISSTANPAASGILRMANNTDKVCWRNGSNSADICVYLTSGNSFNFAANVNAASLTLANVTGGTRCLQADASGNVSGAASGCGQATSGTSILKGDGAGGFSAAIANTDYVATTRTVNGKALSSNITLLLASTDFANQGSNNTVLHGNASGSPTFGPITTSDAPTLAPISSPSFSGTVSIPALSLSSILGSTQCLHVNASGVVSGTGADCGSGGGGGTGTVTVVGSGSVTASALVTGGGTQQIQTPNTGATLDTSGNVVIPGSLTTGNGSSSAGAIQLGQGTTGTPAANSILLQAPTSVTAQTRTFAGTPATGIPHWSNSSGVMTESIGPVNLATSDVTGNLPVTALNSGTGASSTTCWHGDGTWGACGSGGSGSGTVNNANQYGIAYYSTAGTSNTLDGLAAPTSPSNVPQYLVSTNSSGSAAAPAFAPVGLVPNPQTGTTYTIAATDRAKVVTLSNAASIAVTLPQAGTTGFANNFATYACSIGAGTATITPTTSTISYTTGSAYTSGASSMTLASGECASIWTNNTNYFASKYTAGTGSGTVNSGTSGNLAYYASSTNAVSSSSVVAANVATMAANGTSGNLIQSAASDKTQSDSGIAKANVVTAAANFTNGNLVQAAGANKTTSDSGVATANVVTAASNYTSGQFVKAAGNNKTTSSAAIAAADLPVVTVSLTSSTPVSVSSTLASAIYYNQHATAATAIEYDLPTAAAGKQFCFANSYNGSAANTGALTIKTSASGQYIIFKDGTLSATGGNVASGGAGGDSGCVVGVDSTHWQFYPGQGTWTKN